MNKEFYTIKNSWEDVTIREFQQICNVDVDGDELSHNIELLTILSNKDSEFWGNVNLSTFKLALLNLSFLKVKPTHSQIRVEYIIGEKKYILSDSVKRFNDCPINELKTIQGIGLFSRYEQYKSHIDQINNLHNELSIIMIPEGMEYGKQGYSVSENAQFIRDNMSICDALAVSAFFLLVRDALETGLKASLTRQMKKMEKKKKIDPQKMNQLRQMIAQLTR